MLFIYFYFIVFAKTMLKLTYCILHHHLDLVLVYCLNEDVFFWNWLIVEHAQDLAFVDVSTMISTLDPIH